MTLKRKDAKSLISDLEGLEASKAHKILIELVEQCPEVTTILSVLVQESRFENEPFLLAEIIEKSIIRTFSQPVQRKRPGPNPHRHRDERHDPSEEVSELLIEALGPYVERLVHLLNRQNDDAAIVWCTAIIAALYKSRAAEAVTARTRGLSLEELDDEFASAAEWAARLWRTGGDLDKAGARQLDPNRTIPEEFVDEHVPEWDWLLAEQ